MPNVGAGGGAGGALGATCMHALGAISALGKCPPSVSFQHASHMKQQGARLAPAQGSMLQLLLPHFIGIASPAKTAPAKTPPAALSAAPSTGAGKTGGETGGGAGGKVEDTGTTGKGVEGGAVVSALHTADRSVTLSSLRILRQYVLHSLN